MTQLRFVDGRLDARLIVVPVSADGHRVRDVNFYTNAEGSVWVPAVNRRFGAAVLLGAVARVMGDAEAVSARLLGWEHLNALPFADKVRIVNAALASMEGGRT